jgi:hypothetical protein
MRRIGTAVTGIALVAAAVGTWSTSFIVPDAAALVTSPAALEQTAAAAIAARFPSEREMFDNVITVPNGILVAPDAKSTRSAALFPCAGNVAFLLHDCFASQAKPTPPQREAAVVAPRPATVTPPPQAADVPPREAAVVAPTRPATVERRPVANTPEPLRTTPVAARIAPVTATPPESCKQNLPAATARMERILSQIKTARASADACASHRASFFEMVQVRDVTALCRTGGDRNAELVRIDSAVDTINAAIARSCDSI